MGELIPEERGNQEDADMVADMFCWLGICVGVAAVIAFIVWEVVI